MLTGQGCPSERPQATSSPVLAAGHSLAETQYDQHAAAAAAARVSTACHRSPIYPTYQAVLRMYLP